jgi:hypothetical protein
LVLFLWERLSSRDDRGWKASPTNKNLLADNVAPLKKLVRVAALISVQATLSGNGRAKSTPALLT